MLLLELSMSYLKSNTLLKTIGAIELVKKLFRINTLAIVA